MKYLASFNGFTPYTYYCFMIRAISLPAVQPDAPVYAAGFSNLGCFRTGQAGAIFLFQILLEWLEFKKYSKN